MALGRKATAVSAQGSGVLFPPQQMLMTIAACFRQTLQVAERVLQITTTQAGATMVIAKIALQFCWHRQHTVPWNGQILVELGSQAAPRIVQGNGPAKIAGVVTAPTVKYGAIPEQH